MPGSLGEGLSKRGRVVKKVEFKYKRGMEPLCSPCHLPQAITWRQDTLQVLSELILFYRRWKDEEKES